MIDVDDVSLAAPVEHFRCAPYASLLRRNACGERYARMNRTGAAAPELEQRIRDGKCIACPVGEVHEQGGRHPDAPRTPAPTLAPPRPLVPGAPKKTTVRDGGAMALGGMERRGAELRQAARAGVKAVARPPGTAPRAPLPTASSARTTTPPARAGETKETTMRRQKATVTFKRRTQTVPAWAAELECSTVCVVQRVKRGIPLDAPKAPGSPSVRGTWNYDMDVATGNPPTKRKAPAPKPAKLSPAKAAARSQVRPPAARALPPPARDPLAPRKLTAAEVLRWLGYQVDELELPGVSDVLLRVRAGAAA